jgi:hypothetical protein
MVEWYTNDDVLERIKKEYVVAWSTIYPIICWGDGENPRNVSVSMDGILAEMRTKYLPNTNLEQCLYIELFSETRIKFLKCCSEKFMFQRVKYVQSQSYLTTGGLQPISSSWRKTPWDPRPVFNSFQLNTCSFIPYVTSSLMRAWFCRLQLLLDFASGVILWSENCGTHDHIKMAQTWVSPTPGGPGHRISIPQE